MFRRAFVHGCRMAIEVPIDTVKQSARKSARERPRTGDLFAPPGQRFGTADATGRGPKGAGERVVESSDQSSGRGEIEFRICQFSIQGNHIHLICEATNEIALARGIQGWSVRVARGLNGHLDREGAVFDDRYHVEILKTPSQTRHALCYVLQNAQRHGERLDPQFHGIDPFSSAWWFDGWVDDAWRVGLPPPEARTVAEPKTWLLRVGWKRSRFGLISITEVPPAGRR